MRDCKIFYISKFISPHHVDLVYERSCRWPLSAHECCLSTRLRSYMRSFVCARFCVRECACNCELELVLGAVYRAIKACFHDSLYLYSVAMETKAHPPKSPYSNHHQDTPLSRPSRRPSLSFSLSLSLSLSLFLSL
jgi:hypothetical protein